MVRFESSCNNLLRLWIMAFSCFTFTALHSHAQCPEPGRQGNAVPSDVIGEEFPDGTTITYECLPGYRRVMGSPTVICKNGTWSNLKLKCEKKSCSPPSDVLNGQWVGESIEFGATMTLKCNKGYKVAGRISTMQCESEGWSESKLVCEAVKCPLPPNIQNGRFSPNEDKEFLLYQETVTYSCEKSYTLFGESLLTCTENGTYDAQPPQCRKVNCAPPEVKFGTRVEGGPPPYGQSSYIVFECTEGYEMSGSAKIICQDSIWTPKPPVCQKKVNCAQPEVKFGTQVEGGPPPYGQNSYVVYKCNEGYDMSGSSKIICENNIWSPKPPVCQKKVNCAQPEVKFGTQVEGGPPPYGQNSYVVYKCNEGYDMSGSSKIICKDNIWSPKPPVCQKKVNCAQPEVKFGTQVEGGPPPYGQNSYVVYKCNKGYEMSGSSKIICENNIWSPKPPVCQKSGASCTGSICTEVYSTLVQRVVLALLIPVSLHLSM